MHVNSGWLGATGAKCSTKLKDSTCRCHSGGGVIEVFTTRRDSDKVGMKLIKICQHSIKYKTNEATEKGLYIANGETKTTSKTLKWNYGRGPSY